MTRIKVRDFKTVYKKLNEALKDNPDWKTGIDNEINFEKFFKSSMFKNLEKLDKDEVDWMALTFFVLYSCKGVNSHALNLKISHIEQFCTKSSLMEAESFTEVIKLICRLASVSFLKAVTDIGYMQDLYQESEYEALNQSIDTVCEELTT